MCSIGVKSGLTVAMLVVRCYCLPGNPDKLGQHVVGHCPAAESDYVVAQAGLQQTQDLIPIPYCGHIAQAISDEAVETSSFYGRV